MERNRNIDLIKGILIIFVIMLHFTYEEGEVLKYLFPYTIHMAVPCFMMISGYVTALSYKKKGITNLEDAYEPGLLVDKVLRFMVPFTIAFVAEWILFRVFGLFLVNVKTYGLLAVCLDFLRGGYGQGSYYFPVMLQFVFIFPLIHFIIRKYHFKGLVAIFLMNAVFEVLKSAYGINDGVYRLLVFRYMFIIAAGCFFALEEVKWNRKTIGMGACAIVIGACFVYLFSYSTYSPKIITFWRSTSFLGCLYVFPIMGIILQKGKGKCKPLEFIGKASFNIFLVQMIYYNFANRFYAVIEGRLLQIGFNILFCVTIGCIFYLIEQPITKYILKMKRRH